MEYEQKYLPKARTFKKGYKKNLNPLKFMLKVIVTALALIILRVLTI